MHVAFFLVKAVKAPTLEVTTVLVRVCSPLSSVDSAFVSPKIGSKILNRGFDNMLVK
jgi:hypothetical protein